MPVWNLGDLYPSPTSAEFQRDLDRAAVDAKRSLLRPTRARCCVAPALPVARDVLEHRGFANLVGRRRKVGSLKPPTTPVSAFGAAKATRAQRAISRSICTDGRCVRLPRRSQMQSYKPDSCASWLRRRQSQESCRFVRSSWRDRICGVGGVFLQPVLSTATTC